MPDLLNDRVVPFFNGHEVKRLGLLAERGKSILVIPNGASTISQSSMSITHPSVTIATSEVLTISRSAVSVEAPGCLYGRHQCLRFVSKRWRPLKQREVGQQVSNAPACKPAQHAGVSEPLHPSFPPGRTGTLGGSRVRARSNSLRQPPRVWISPPH